MNIEIANRLVQLRKQKNLSQEALANELGISRQAVSKWERAEASPDTDNLILLAKLYDISLDELLKTDQESFESGAKDKKEHTAEEDRDYVHVSLTKGIHVKEKNGDEVHVGWNGIHVESNDKDDRHKFHFDKNGVYIDDEKYDINEWKQEWKDYHYHYDFPIGVLVVMAYLYIGIAHDAWHPGWLLFGIIPLFHSMLSAYRHRDLLRFSYPVLIFMIIGYYGFVQNAWYPAWLLILTIPVFYSIFGYIHHLCKRNQKKDT